MRRLRSDHSGAAHVGSFVFAVVAVVVALALLPVVVDQIDDIDQCTLADGTGVRCGTDPANETRNLTSTQSTLLNLVPTFYLIGVFVGLIAWLAITRRM